MKSAGRDAESYGREAKNEVSFDNSLLHFLTSLISSHLR